MSYVRHARRSSIQYAAGTQASPETLATYAVWNFASWTPEIVESENGNGFIGSRYSTPAIRSGKYSEIAFDCEVRGQYEADGPPPEGSLIRACGFSETASGSTPSIVYAYVLADPHKIADGGNLDPVDSIYCNIDERQAILLNLVGTQFELDFQAGKIPMYRFQFRGQAPSGGSMAAAGYTEQTELASAFPGKRGVPWGGASCTITGHTGAPRIRGINFKLNPSFDPRPDANGTFGYGIPNINGYDPRLTVQVEENLLASYNPFTQFMADTTITVTWVYNAGGAVGSVLTCTFIGKLAESPKSENMNGTLVHTLSLQQNPASTAFTMAWS